MRCTTIDSGIGCVNTIVAIDASPMANATGTSSTTSSANRPNSISKRHTDTTRRHGWPAAPAHGASSARQDDRYTAVSAIEAADSVSGSE